MGVIPSYTLDLVRGFKNFMQQKHIYTVTELTYDLRVILEDSFGEVWVEGEVSNLRTPSSGHIYFTLKDERAQLNCVIFKSNSGIRFEMMDGIQAICFGRISVYEKAGQYQLYVARLEPKGFGALQLAFEQLKARLSKEGLFDPGHKRPLPLFPQRIGIITSPTGAVIRDLLNILDRRFSNLHIIINPVRVQGDGAAEEIARAVDEFSGLDIAVDVLIVARGGGSIEDLWAFNSEVVARAIYNSRIPVISAVGHQTDTTIADFVADVRAPTPSAAAEMVIVAKQDLLKRIETDLKRLNLVVSNIISQKSQAIDELARSALSCIEHMIAIQKERLANFAGRLEALSPLKVLSRGYSITFRLPKRQLCYDVDVLNVGDCVETRLKHGIFTSRVEDIKVKGER